MVWKELLSTTTFCVHHSRTSCLIRISSHALSKTSWHRFYCSQLLDQIKKTSAENQSLLSNLEIMGVDIKMARKRQPGILKKMITHEESLRKFLQSKGASKETIASIISRYPRAITRTYEHLLEKWDIWQTILKTDLQVLKIVERSPESFFRSGDIDNLEENITFLSSLGLTPKDLSQLLAKAPRTFSNRAELNKQMVDFLQDLCISLGGESPQEFVKQVIIKNIFILIRSTKRLKANIEFLQSTLKLEDKEFLFWIQGNGVDVLDLCNTYIKRNHKSAQKKLLSLGCSEVEIRRFISSYPSILYLSTKNFIDKIDFLTEIGIAKDQILENPRVLEVSIDTLKIRTKDLSEIDYDYQSFGIGILVLSQTRYRDKLEKLCNSR
ncbi:transcription termination factor 1, mitochondrial [Bombina bombina]|uniref:transcription termination factor 1, mitochondrial n=1 Tax=Bombina bombina TaxID=8345 RepID=UPI00235A4A16|nr:transcription termination factor 1, mitochondrial [Bombina bombina]